MSGHWKNINKKIRDDIKKRKSRKQSKRVSRKWQERIESHRIEALRAGEAWFTAELNVQEQSLIEKVNAQDETISAAVAATERQEKLLTAEVAAISEDYGGSIARIFKAAKGCDMSDLLKGIVVVFNERVKHPVKLIGNKLIIGSAKMNRNTSVPYNPIVPGMRS